MEELTNREKALLKFLFKIGEAMTSSNAELKIVDEDYFSFDINDLWRLAQKIGFDI